MAEFIKRKKQYVILSVLLCAVTVFGILQYKRAEEYEYLQEIEYNRVFAELTEYVDDIEISLLKGQLVKSPIAVTHFASELYRQASAAKANLALLPIDSFQLENTSRFLSQVGEYANCISEKMLRGEEATEQELKTIGNLTGYARTLKKGLDEMLLQINNGEMSFTEEKKKLTTLMQGEGVVMASSMEALEEEFHSYPSLIYDGPFSQHLSLKESLFTGGKAEISLKQAQKNARVFMGDSETKASRIDGKLPAYSVKNQDMTVEYTKKGGVLLLLIKDRSCGEEKLTVKQAKEKAEKFLTDNGFDNLTASYYEKRGGSVVINYAYTQDNYIVYSDLVKVKVALDNGEVIGFESRGYVMNHIYRDIPEPKITPQQAKETIHQSLTTEDEVKMAVIPLENGSEASCYQIKGKVSGRNFLVYVNTQTGNVEDIQILIESETGTLAV